MIWMLSFWNWVEEHRGSFSLLHEVIVLRLIEDRGHRMWLGVMVLVPDHFDILRRLLLDRRHPHDFSEQTRTWPREAEVATRDGC